MRINNFLILLIISILFLNIVSATTTLGVYKQGECVELKQTCASCTYVTFTRVSYPNSTVAARNLVTDVDSSLFNYTFCNTTALGEYIVEGIGDVDGTDTIFVYDFEITSNGDNYTTSDSITNVALIIFFFLLILGVYILNKNIDFDKWNNAIIRKYENKNYVKLVLHFIYY